MDKNLNEIKRKPINFHAVKKNPQEIKINFKFKAEPDQIERLIDDANRRKPDYKIPKEGRNTIAIEINYEKVDDVLIEPNGLAEALFNALSEGDNNRTDSIIVKRQLPFDFPESYAMIIMRMVDEKRLMKRK